MAASSKRLASTVSCIASCLYLLIIIFRVPLFRVQCRLGKCTSPLEVTSSHLIASQLFPPFLVNSLLYPGAIAIAYMKNSTIPTYTTLLNHYNLNNLHKYPSSPSDLQHLEILVGCYLSVAGAVLNLSRHGRMTLFGTLLIIWGFGREVIMRILAGLSPMKTIRIYPAMYVTLLCAFLSIRKDVRSLIRSCKPWRVAKSMRKKIKNV